MATLLISVINFHISVLTIVITGFPKDFPNIFFYQTVNDHLSMAKPKGVVGFATNLYIWGLNYPLR